MLLSWVSIQAQESTILSKKDLLATKAFTTVEKVVVNPEMIKNGTAPIVLLDYKEILDAKMIDLSKVIETKYMDKNLVRHLYPSRPDRKVLHLKTKLDSANPPIFTTVVEMPYLKSCENEPNIDARSNCNTAKYNELLLPHCLEGITLLQLHINKEGDISNYNMFKNGNDALNTFLKEWSKKSYLFMPGKQSNTFVDTYVTLQLTK